jgi:ABC-type antimicrobial peptide transport system permease subunit
MGRLLLIIRLAIRDLGHRPAQAVLLLLAITAAAATLTLGLALHGTASHPYETTRAATNGPDILALAQTVAPETGVSRAEFGRLTALAHAAGVTGHSGPYPYTFAVVRADGHETSVMVEGRGEAPASIDQPYLTAGSWVHPGAAVVERAFADALGVRVGDTITLNDRRFLVAGIAVSAAVPAYPGVCFVGCDLDTTPQDLPGLIWLTQTDARGLATATEPLAYMLDLKLRDPGNAPAFANAYDNQTQSVNGAPYLTPWQGIAAKDGQLVSNEQEILTTGGWLLGLLALASVAVLVGGRMAEQTRRVGLLKAAGGTPALVTVVQLGENLAVGLVAAVAGLLAGRLAAPALTSPGTGLVGAPGAPPVTPAVIGLVVAMALGIAVLATLVPVIRAARASTVAALADTTRAPRRGTWLIALSARLPVPLLLGLRLTARRPRRALLSAASITVTAAGIVAVLLAHASFDTGLGGGLGLDNPRDDRLSQVMLVLTIALALLSAINAILVTWATMLDTRHSSALTRALGASPGQVSVGVSVAQALPALIGAVAGVPAGFGLFAAVKSGGQVTMPPAWWLAATVLGTVAVVLAITAVPAWLGSRRPAAEILTAEVA